MKDYRREPLTQEEATRIANACQTAQERLIIWTLLDTGLRVGELANLTKDNIDWQGHRIIVHGKGGHYGKQSKRRIVPMTDRIQPLLESYYALNDSFILKQRQMQRIVKEVANRARIKKEVTPHVLRHTFAVTVVQKGISTRTLQQILGHDHLSTTEIYLNLSPEEALNEFKRKW